MSHHAFYHREYIAPEMIEARKMMDEMHAGAENNEQDGCDNRFFP
jgi:hypothetical protein